MGSVTSRNFPFDELLTIGIPKKEIKIEKSEPKVEQSEPRIVRKKTEGDNK